jgi:Zn finger protein HypA/HybF involved in hydrogenase expression
MANRPANRRKVMAMCAKCTCNTWVFARLKSDQARTTAWDLRCPHCSALFSVRESGLSLRRIPIEWSKSAARKPKTGPSV